MALNKDEIAAWTDEIIQCRSGGHWWNSQIVATYYSYPPGYQRRGKGSLDARDRGQLRLAAKNLAKL
jgi:hypothetical protein